MAAGEEREVLVRTTLRELIVYLVFLVILCVGKLLSIFFILFFIHAYLLTDSWHTLVFQ